jgi:CBS domain-containing protein
MRAAELCTRDVYLARPGDALSHAAREMRRRHVGALVVAEPAGNRIKPVGIVTDRDILCGQLRRGADIHCLTVGDVMTTDLTTVGEDDEVADIIKRLATAGVRRAPVVNAAGDLVGILSFDDILPVVAEELTTLARLIGTQSRTEGFRRSAG